YMPQSHRALKSCGILSSFFFSSRRRHTRFSRDWSSDVCSSDLIDGAINVPATVRAQPDGQLRLIAERGQGIGPNIKYMPEWKAFGWYTAADRVEWEVEIKEAGQYHVFLDWSVSDDTAGNPFVFEGGGASIEGVVGKT